MSIILPINFGFAPFQREVPYPNSVTQATGRFDAILDRNDESWYFVTQDDRNFLHLKEIVLNANLPTLLSVIISVILVIYICILLIFGVIYGVDRLYLDIVEHVKNVGKYSSIDQGDKGIQEKLFHEDENQDEEKEDDEKKQNEDGSGKVKAADMNAMMHPFTLIRILFNLAPPLSAFIDYLVNLLIK